MILKSKGQIQVELQDVMGNDRSVANAAWTSSFDKDKRDARTDEQVASLVTRLADEGHSTPFESVVFRFWIRHPIFVDRQHMTHRIASHNGLSGRYRTMPLDYFHIPDDVQKILYKLDGQYLGIKQDYYNSCDIAVENYNQAIQVLKQSEKNGVITNAEFKRAREILRGQLPTAGMTERTTVINLRSFANYQRLRNSKHAQPEICTVAKLMLECVKESGVASAAITALEKNEWVI